MRPTVASAEALSRFGPSGGAPERRGCVHVPERSTPDYQFTTPRMTAAHLSRVALPSASRPFVVKRRSSPSAAWLPYAAGLKSGGSPK